MFLLNAQPCWAGAQARDEIKQGNSLYNQGKFSQALKNYERALLNAPESDIVNFNLGAALYKTGDYKAAISHFEKSLLSEEESLEQRASYNTANAKYKYGIGKEKTDLPGAVNSLKGALHHYERALELDPKDEDAGYNYEFVKKELERLQKKLKKQQQEQKEQRKQKKQQQEQAQKQGQQKEQQKKKGQQQEQSQNAEEAEAKQQQGQRPQAAQGKQQQPPSDEQTTQVNQPSEEMSEQEASMLLNSYAQEEEPRGLYREKMPQITLPEVEKDW